MRSLIAIVICVSMFATLAGCKPSGAPRTGGRSGKPQMIKVKGSDTMVNLGQAWAEAYMKKSRSAMVTVTGGGSGTGIAALLQKQTDIAETSRACKDEELAQANAAGVSPKEITVGWDGIAVIVNPKNPVKSLTIDQLADIYTGKVTDWKAVGGKPGKIVFLARELNSGTYVFFKEHVIQKGNSKSKADYANSALMLPSSQAVCDEVGGNSNAIGYVGLGYVKSNMRALPVSSKGKAPITPSADTVLDKSYPISRPLYFYTNGEPTGEIKNFVDFVLSPDGQQIVKDLDFVPLKK